MALVCGVAGCQKQLFPQGAPRSQYDRYAMLRGKMSPEKRTNQFGVEEPALRDRLAPLDQKE